MNLPPNSTTRLAALQLDAADFEEKFARNSEPGALFAAIEPFKALKINMSKIESRPSKRKAWEYFFFVDIDGHATEQAVIDAFAALAKHCTFVKVLGAYPKTQT